MSNGIVVFAAIVASTVMVMDDVSEDEEDDELLLLCVRQKVPKVLDYAESIVPAMSDETFRRHFRLLRTTFSILVDRLEVLLDETDEPSSITVEKQVMVSIWLLANRDSFREVGDRFNLSQSTAHRLLFRVVAAILKLNLRDKIITWPDENRSLEIQTRFQRRYGFPGVVGAIDGSHVPIPAPSISPSSYVNRKGFHSILLQGVCDDRLLFLDCYAGEVGSIHDSAMFRRSDLYTRIETSPLIFPNNSHIIGDLAYPLKQHLIVGFKDNGHLTRKQQKYNCTLSAARSSIERCFAWLKGRWHRLKYLDMSNIAQIANVIIACCVLHNVCIMNNDFIDVPTDPTNDGDTAAADNQVPPPAADSDRDEGVRKRRNIMEAL